MFDVGFFELILISIVALLVLGPDRLPGAIRTMGLWVGRMRRSFNNIKREIEQEIGADEIRRQLRNEAIMEKFNSTRQQITDSVDSVKKQAESIKDDLDISKEFKGLTGDEGDEKQGNNPPNPNDPLDPLINTSSAPESDPATATGQPAAEQEKKTPAPEQDTSESSLIQKNPTESRSGN